MSFFTRPALFLCSRSTIQLQFSRGLASTVGVAHDFTHCVIGAGVVGLAVARRLAQIEGASTVLLEKHNAFGTETSSRNSEIIHAGLYYPKDSLKTELCIKGKDMLYELCQKENIPFRRTGKWIVAQTAQQWEDLRRMHEHAESLGVSTRFVDKDEAAHREPEVRAEFGILESPTTGIIDSHAYMTYLLGAFENAGGDYAVNTSVEKISQHPSGKGFTIHTKDTSSPDSEATEITATKVINAAGLYAIPLSNTILPPERHLKPYYCKGNYFTYSLPFAHPIQTLLYPSPSIDKGGLGTHLTLDMGGGIKFGPDIEWVEPPLNYDVTANERQLDEVYRVVKEYLPDIKREGLQMGYSGIRPKAAPVGNVADFIIREETDCGLDGFVNLLGIESPGLTSSLAIAEKVYGLLEGK
ncbi:FAD dependent oxidoreductase [Ascobolus immersus RN42]|uniref:L-2-hydroxyglutarate dehydrogenase, mitochondrial n=1 Tax=Ascobolus immersus RN42 TaxID=1160509 RepID=A0A3N4IPX2_ASCIM|nr:FAD dependent oxidoreductase [Ascobolus immersus RN42]